ncbi:hypothetical protein [Modestobacter sp. Leaf380]|uniref:hypothetical protein n=1 Tax=Modestobacter sp. Leaf380 TaxID=1736356 RepID=UPI0006F6EED1|nr:hypothetical protein [Modestobacter sp. Leaf380]KQS66213.1 hypothetical protein ASG41_12865 [Modestobacter sp. Leaf380]
MARRQRRENDEPPAVRAARDRERHVSQVTSYGFLARRGPKRSTTVQPAPLRYWQYNPVSPTVAALAVVVVAVWLGVLALIDGPAAARDEAPLAVGLGLLVLVLATSRFTVSDHGLSGDIAGIRQTSSFGIVPLVLVEDVAVAPAPADWPRAKRRGGWWPGRTRVVVRHLGGDGVADKAFSVWVRDADGFADALDRPLS